LPMIAIKCAPPGQDVPAHLRYLAGARLLRWPAA
jgi:hypothetical protein